MKVVLLLILALQGQKPVTVQLEQPSIEVCEAQAKKFMRTPLPQGAVLKFKLAGCGIGDPTPGTDAKSDAPVSPK